MGSVADVRCTPTRSREEELGTTSWASWDTDTQLTATWPVGILKTDDMDVKLGNSGICEFSNHHSAQKIVSTYPVKCLNHNDLYTGKSLSHYILFLLDWHIDHFFLVWGLCPWCKFRVFLSGSSSKGRLLPPDFLRTWLDLSGTSWSHCSPFYDVAHLASLAQVTYADPETAAWQGCRGVRLREMQTYFNMKYCRRYLHEYTENLCKEKHFKKQNLKWMNMM